jgi:hypothetical protein
VPADHPFLPPPHSVRIPINDMLAFPQDGQYRLIIFIAGAWWGVWSIWALWRLKAHEEVMRLYGSRV